MFRITRNAYTDWYNCNHKGSSAHKGGSVLAKEGQVWEVMEHPPIPKFASRESFFYNQWSQWWQQLSSCCQTKIWISMPGKIGKEVNLLGCDTLSTVIQALMSHNYLNYHCSKVSKVNKFPQKTATSVGKSTRSLCILHVSAQRSPGSIWLAYITSNLVHLQTLLALLDSWKWIALPRLWNGGQMKMSTEVSVPWAAL